MKMIYGYIDSICRLYSNVLKGLVAALVPILIVTVTYQIAARYIGFIPRFLWTEEISRFTLIWLVMIGSTLGVYNRDHFDIDVFPNLGRAKAKVRVIVVDVIITIFLLIIVLHGREFAESGLRRTSLAARVSMVWVYSSFLFFGISSLVFQIRRFLALWLGEDTGKSGSAPLIPIQASQEESN